MARKKQTFDEAMERLEEIVEQLEQEEVSLETAVSLYKEGLSLAALCREKLWRRRNVLPKGSRALAGGAVSGGGGRMMDLKQEMKERCAYIEQALEQVVARTEGLSAW